jgi:hypothetical protein
VEATDLETGIESGEFLKSGTGEYQAAASQSIAGKADTWFC